MIKDFYDEAENDIPTILGTLKTLTKIIENLINKKLINKIMPQLVFNQIAIKSRKKPLLYKLAQSKRASREPIKRKYFVLESKCLS